MHLCLGSCVYMNESEYRWRARNKRTDPVSRPQLVCRSRGASVTAVINSPGLHAVQGGKHALLFISTLVSPAEGFSWSLDHGLIVVLCCLICRLVRKKRGEKRKRRNTWRREKLLHSLSQTVFTWALLRGIESKRIQPHPWVQVLLVNGNCHNLECR